MACDGGVGTCAYDPCGQMACLNEHGYCSTSCQEADEEGTVPADLTPPAAPSTATQPSGPGGRGGRAAAAAQPPRKAAAARSSMSPIRERLRDLVRLLNLGSHPSSYPRILPPGS